MAEPLVCSCGCDCFWESTRANGWWRALIDGYGNVEETDLSNLKHGPHPDTVTCADCGKRLPNPLAGTAG